MQSRSRDVIHARCSTRNRVTSGGSGARRETPASRRSSTISESYTVCKRASLFAMCASRHARWSAVVATRHRGDGSAPDATSFADTRVGAALRAAVSIALTRERTGAESVRGGGDEDFGVVGRASLGIESDRAVGDAVATGVESSAMQTRA